MNALLAFPVALPLAGAAFVAFTDGWTPRRFRDVPAIALAAATTTISIIVLVRSERTTLVHWFGGWQPRHGLALGIGFVAEPLGAGLAALAGVLVTAALVYSWHYMEEAPRLYRVLMLVFLAGLSGFALSGDLFNMFVWFELMGVAAYALAGYMVEELGPLQGALNFAVTNSIGAFMILFATALLYGRTGALNLAQIGRTLAGHSPDGLVVVAFALLAAGLLVKSALVPFHLWLADAYAVSPAPVCVVFAGAMSEVGLFGLARIYWTLFEEPFAPSAAAVRNVLLAVGISTALLGAVMAFLQRHLKRLLAYTVISHVGATLCGIALLNSTGLAGAANLVLSHGFLNGALFLACGVLLREFRGVDELNLHGRGRALPLLGLAFAFAGFGLSGFPYVGTFMGHSLLDDSAAQHGHAWISPLLMVAAGISAGAILRAAARVFLGWGPKRDPLLTREPPEEPPEEAANRALMVTAVVALVVVGLGLSLTPGLQDRTEHAADRFRDRHAYVERTLFGRARTYGPSAPVVLHRASGTSVGYGVGATAIAFATVLFGLFRRRIPEAVRAFGTRYLDPALEGLRAAHSGIVGDYVMWITVGTAVLGGVWALTLTGGP
jgi:multicomponent Na+:H+ antiporter subunit D